MAAPGVLGEIHDPAEHRRHGQQDAGACPLDELKGRLGIEAAGFCEHCRPLRFQSGAEVARGGVRHDTRDRQQPDRRIQRVARGLDPGRSDRDLGADVAERRSELAHVHRAALVAEHRHTGIGGEVEEPHQATARNDAGRSGG